MVDDIFDNFVKETSLMNDEQKHDHRLLMDSEEEKILLLSCSGSINQHIFYKDS